MRRSVLAISAALGAAVLALCGSVHAEESVRYQTLLTPLLEAGADILGRPIAYPPGTPNVTAAIVTIPPGGASGWHVHEVPLFVQILEGEISVDYGQKGTKVYRAGDTLMEAMDWPHNGTNSGSVPVRILAVYLGGAGRANAAGVAAPN